MLFDTVVDQKPRLQQLALPCSNNSPATATAITAAADTAAAASTNIVLPLTLLQLFSVCLKHALLTQTTTVELI
jgi:hypothetical protein